MASDDVIPALHEVVTQNCVEVLGKEESLESIFRKIRDHYEQILIRYPNLEDANLHIRVDLQRITS